MWDYTDKVKDHFYNPRNVGKLKSRMVSAKKVLLPAEIHCGSCLNSIKTGA